MPAPRRVAELLPNEPPVCQQAEAIREHATAIDNAVERFGPAADAIASMATRADRLCAWLSGRKPWVCLLAAVVITRTVNMAPDDVPKLVNAVAVLMKAFGG